MELLEQISQKLQDGEPEAVADLTQAGIDSGLEAKKILDAGLIAGMNVVGERFKAHEIFLPDVLLAAKAMYAGLDLLKPLLAERDVPRQGKVVLGTVQGDIHDIGKNLVAIMLRGAGFDVVDLGKDVPPQKFIEAAVTEGAEVIGLSTLLTTTMPVMKTVVDLAREQGVLGRVKVVVGGAPLSADYAREIGAHAYGYDGMNAVDCIKQLLGRS